MLHVLRENKLDAKFSKCSFSLESIKFIGHIISSTGIAVDPRKTKAIKEWPSPTTLTELRGFLRLCSYYRRFVNKFAEIAAPLTNLLKNRVLDNVVDKHNKFVVPSEAESAFQALKEALMTTPVLIVGDSEIPWVIYPDASQFAVVFILLQDQGKGLQPIAYESKKLNAAKCNSHDLEAFPIIHCLKVWR